jgi:hypothetical protein
LYSYIGCSVRPLLSRVNRQLEAFRWLVAVSILP